MGSSQTKSKQRVADHGEVFTAEREVNAMLDLVKDTFEHSDSRFLEPACGHGNFLAEILRRKLVVVKMRYGKNPDDYERYAVIAVMGIYGVDILRDNVDECRERIFCIFDEEYRANCKKTHNDETRDAVRHILKHNILCGDALTMLTTDGKPIIFAEWSDVGDGKISRRDYRFDQMLKQEEDNLQLDFLGDSGIYEYDNPGELILKDVGKYEVVHFKRLWEAEKIE